jgi:hypothetical protein
MLLDEEARAEVAAGLLVAQDDQHDVAGRRPPLPVESQDCVDEHGHAGFHVERAAAPDLAVLEPPLERRVRPALPRSRDDVDVTLEEERRAAGARQPRDEVRPRRILRVARRLDSRGLEPRLEIRDAWSLVPRRVGRVEPDQVLEELDDTHGRASKLLRAKARRGGPSCRRSASRLSRRRRARPSASP